MEVHAEPLTNKRVCGPFEDPTEKGQAVYVTYLHRFRYSHHLFGLALVQDLTD